MFCELLILSQSHGDDVMPVKVGCHTDKNRYYTLKMGGLCGVVLTLSRMRALAQHSLSYNMTPATHTVFAPTTCPMQKACILARDRQRLQSDFPSRTGEFD